MNRSIEIQNALFKAKKELSFWLQTKMTAIDDNYWENMVLPKLSYQQDIMIKQKQIDSLNKLDLSCLLRIFDKNWYDLNSKYHLNPQLRSYLKELQIIRNKYAHQTDDFSDIEMNRDIDTLYFFLSGIGANDEFIASVKQLMIKSKDIEQDIIEPNISQPISITNSFEAKSLEQIQPNKIVRIKANPSITGVVLSIDGNEVSVFINGEIKPFYINQIECIEKKEDPFIPLSTVRNYLTSFVIRQPLMTSLYSLNAARIDSIPYQFKPVIKIMQSDQPRILIADGVGIGKTIEAGLILRELQIRNDLKSVLVICPKPLVSERKWEQEMKKFDEDFETLDSSTLKYCIDEYSIEGEWPEKYKKAILPFSICDKNTLEILKKLNPFPSFDLVIVDEAHHLKNPEAIRHQVVEQFCLSAEAIVFLTATPIQLGNNDLFVLLNLLRPDLLPNKETFDIMHQPNKHINAAIRYIRANKNNNAKNELLSAIQTTGGNLIKSRPDFKQVMDMLAKDVLSLEEKVTLIDILSKMHTFSTIINRTQRKDVASDFCMRHSNTVQAIFSKEEQSVFDNLISLKSKILEELHGTSNVKFMMTTLERQASSCLHGLSPLIGSIFNKTVQNDDIDFSDISASNEDLDSNSLDDYILIKYKKEIDQLIYEAENLPPYDPKFEAFYKVIQEKQTLENKKVIVFSTFRHTLTYLKEQLENKGIRVGLIHGGIDDTERVQIRNRFKESENHSDSFDVLLFSDVGCEGLDYQFCDTMINYDLPWNPMKIEQRIGRIDRFGQQSEAVAIYNMVVQGTIDASIYYRCLNRINIFQESIGDCDEILGEIHNEIKSVCENTKLTPEQKDKKLEKIAQNHYQSILEQRDLEKHQLELFCIPNKLTSEKEVEKFENYWISPIALEKIVIAYLQKKTNSNVITGTGAKRSLRLSKEVKQLLLDDYLKLPHRKGKIYKSWENYLKGFDQTIPITFDMGTARIDQNIQFIMPLHPLVIAAANEFESKMPIRTAFKIIDNDIPEGEYPFQIFSWEYKGFTPNIKLKAICSEKAIEENLLNLLEVGAPIPDTKFPEDAWQKIKEEVHLLWQKDAEDHKLNTQQWKDYKTKSLEVSTNARKNVAKQRSSGIKDMQENWILKIENEYQNKLKELDKISKTADIHRTPILSGIVKIVHE